MNILVLNGSPRSNGNTSVLVETFTTEAQKAGHNVSVFQIGNKDIRGCKNCDACRATLNGNFADLLLFTYRSDALCNRKDICL